MPRGLIGREVNPDLSVLPQNTVFEVVIEKLSGEISYDSPHETYETIHLATLNDNEEALVLADAFRSADDRVQVPRPRQVLTWDYSLVFYGVDQVPVPSELIFDTACEAARFAIAVAAEQGAPTIPTQVALLAIGETASEAI